MLPCSPGSARATTSGSPFSIPGSPVRMEREPDTHAPPEEEEGPDASELDEDPAYEPEDEGLKDIKGG